ncbi:MAG: shikimate dehydrogenase [Lentisphaerae bacterium]|nr:shikimate dehydrogenase [Lentisphaerota bacterium]
MNIAISPSTVPYAVLGHPIRHSLSPRMHNAAFAALGMDAIYLAFDVPPEKLKPTLLVMADLGFAGINLTVPLKEAAFRALVHLDQAARNLGSVNTIKIAGGLKGFSTDGEGFLRAIREDFDLTIKGLSLFILGCGGAGRAVAFACATAGAKRITLADADIRRLERLEADLRSLKLNEAAIASAGTAPPGWTGACHKADLVVHATPMGMRPNEKSLLPRQAFRRRQFVYDLIYMFPETVLMRAAREAGARVANGLGMLLHQGALSFFIWTDRPPPLPVMRRALEEAVYGKLAK